MELEKDELDKLFSLTYEELRRLAAAVKNGDPGQTLNLNQRLNLFLSVCEPVQSVNGDYF